MDDMKDIVIKTYDATVKDYVEQEWDNPQMEKYYDQFLKLLPEESKILDIGCGPGQAAKRFAQKEHEVIGIDLSKEMIAYAKKHVPQGEFFVMDIEEMKFSETFDAIWAAFILVHLPREKHLVLLKKMYELLKPGGILYLGMLEGAGEKTIPEPYNRKYKQYFVFITKKELEKILQETGFVIKSYATESFDEKGEKFILSSTFAKKT